MQETVKTGKSGGFPLAAASVAELGLHAPALDKLRRTIEGHIAEGRYPGAQIAIARHGKLALAETYGLASLEPKTPARDDTLWLMFSNTKVITAAGIWALVEDGALRFTDKISDHIPEFAKHGKGDITIVQLLSHRGGFPSAEPNADWWSDHEKLRRMVCDFTLEWTPGSRLVYHGRSAHHVAAALIEAVAKVDFRDFIKSRIVEPLGLGRELFVGLPDAEHARAVAMYEPDGKQQKALADSNTAPFRRAGVPSGGGYGTARAMAAFYQMMAGEGRLGAVRLFSPRLVQYVTRNVTGDMVDGYMGMPMHRGLGPHVRGTTDTIRGLGSLASPRTFGHGGVGSSYCWADPDSGVSFAYFTNSRIPDPWHTLRLDVISNFVHTAID
jgi:CubicO group peptidase (beta-lactamase class C family)